MVKARLQQKKGYYYAVLTFKSANGKRKEIWRATGIKISDNIKKAQLKCDDYREKLIIELNVIPDDKFLIQSGSKFLLGNMNKHTLFGNYLEYWVEFIKNNIEPTTFSSYKCIILNIIKPFFNNLNIRLTDISPRYINAFYIERINHVKPNTIKHYHAIIYQALKFAYDNDLVVTNMAAKIKLPKIHDYICTYYNASELKELMQLSKGKQIEFAVLMAAYYGLRRSEIIGIKWSAIDFIYKTLTIRHTVVEYSLDGKIVREGRDNAKSKKSIRTLPLFPIIEKFLLDLKVIQQYNKKICGNNYCTKYEEYVYVDQFGELIKPNFISQNFKILLKNNNLKLIRFQDLRHSCATLLRHQGARMEDVQKWLGHSSIEITEKFYSHFENVEFIKSAKLIENALGE